MRLVLPVFLFAAAVAAVSKPAPFPFPAPSAEDQWKWSQMDIIPRGCPGGDGNTCCPEGQFSCSDGERCICQPCGYCCGEPCGSGNCC